MRLVLVLFLLFFATGFAQSQPPADQQNERCGGRGHFDRVLKVAVPNIGPQKSEAEAKVREFLWNAWTSRQKACVEEQRNTREGEEARNLYIVEPNKSGIWAVLCVWSVSLAKRDRSNKARPVKSEFWAYSLKRVAKDARAGNAFEEDQFTNEYVVFKDAHGTELMRY